ncbi:MAG: hypothetical protein BMS9Abin20_1466 [Acidimicrobiia bacterium]|nr:MAG: hypothetical protein BMS9Abin20_1466 [Acidimicrobiia bacterium]
MKGPQRSVLANVVAVARRELADRDDADVPSRLRRVARSTARSLPPPFANALLREIQENEVFRDAVQQRWEDEELDDSVGEAFLDDPSESTGEITATARDLRVVELEQEVERTQQRVRSLEQKLREAKHRLSAVRADHEVALAAMQLAEKASKDGLVGTVRELEGKLRASDDERNRLTARIAALEAETAEAATRLARSAERARRKDVPVSTAKNRETSVPPSDPVTFAAWLDTIERIQRPFREAKRTDSPMTSQGSLMIPSGMRPDGREALVALIRQGPDTIVIDGYNVAGLFMPEDFSSPAARSAVIAKAERLAAASGADVVVVFDAAAVDGRRVFRSPGGVDVRFSCERTADDEIVEIVHGGATRSIVISNDREIRERCSGEGCVPVWSSAFVAWANR